MASKAAIEQCAKALYEKVRSAWNNPGQNLYVWLSDLQAPDAKDFSVKDCEVVAAKATELLQRDEVYAHITHHTNADRKHYFLATWPGPPES